MRTIVSGMPNSLLSGWSTQKREAARLRAIGYTQQMTAEAIGAGMRTVQGWCAEPEFDSHVQRLHEEAFRRIEPQLMANLEMAISVQRDMFAGRISPSEKRYIEAAKLIDRLLDRLLYTEPAEPASSKPAVGVTVINGQLPPTE